MDYKELTEALKSMLPEKVLYGDLIGAEGVYAHSGPLVYEDPEPYFIEQAITAITELLSRAEAAEARAEAAEKKAADVRPVVQGRWIEKPYLLGTTNVCSVCGENYGMPHGEYNFCPNCGADMRGGSEQ